MGARSTTAEQVLARVGSRAHGVASRSELLAGGVTRREIARRLARGALIREYPGVYRVGHAAPSTEAGYTAAVKACGEGAGLSGLAAAHVMGLTRGRPPAPEVTTLAKRRVTGVITHRSRRIERWTFNGIPTTTVARTLVDIAGRLTEEELARACHEAQVRYRTTPNQVEAVLRHRPNSPGAKKLRRAIRGDSHVSLSALERKFLARLKGANLPLPDETNRRAGSKRVDCRWKKQRLTVELDSYRFHNSRHAFEQDRKREREAYRRGDDFRRYTYGDVYEHPTLMLAELTDLLAQTVRPGRTPESRRRS